MRRPRSGRRFSVSRLKQIGLAYCFLVPALAIMGLFIFFPVIQAFRLSLYDYVPLMPKKYIGLENFYRLFREPLFWTSLINSIKYLMVVPIIIVLSLGLAMLAEPQVRGVNFFRACYYVPVVTSMVVVGITWKIIFHEDYGLFNHILIKLWIIDRGIPWLNSIGLALYTVMSVTIWKGLGYYMVIFIAGLRSIPPELIEAAMIDGAKKWQQALYVKIPMLWPYISLVAIISSISALQVFDEIFVMTMGKPLNSSSTLVFYLYRAGIDQEGGQNMGYASAMGVVLFALLLIFTIISIRLMQRREYGVS
jgi:putative chitobiose transport system permease protein